MTAHLSAVGAALGAWWMVDAPLPLVVVVVLVAVLRRHVVLVGLAFLVITGGRGVASIEARDPPPAGAFEGWVTLVDDPRPSGPVGIVVTVRHQGRRLTATVHGPLTGRVDDALAGERILVSGSIRPASPDDDYARWRHVVGRITVESVDGHQRGSPVARFANSVRRTLGGGVESFDRSERALFLGMVIGDDRGQTPTVADDFRAAGLGHLLVVSGQNVAFVLAVVAPVVGRWRPAYRAIGLAGVLILFAVVTRFEPSVLRAVAMAGAGVGASAMGRPIDGRRALSWAIAVLLVVDPFLVHLVAFQLSVAATAGIVWWSAALAPRLVGPSWVRVPLATTAAAQLAVSPVLLGLFGPLPLAALPANLLAGPASGAVMVWGCTGGLVAGVLGGAAADLIHLPTRAMLWWIGGVARGASRGPPAVLGGDAMLMLGAAALVVLSGIRRLPWVAAGLVLFVFTVSVMSAPSLSPGRYFVDGASVWVAATGESILVLDDPPRPQRLLEALRESGAGSPTLIITLDGDRADADAVIALTDRFGTLAVASPPLHRVPGGHTVVKAQVVEVGDLMVRFDAVAPRLIVTISPVAPDLSGVAGGG